MQRLHRHATSAMLLALMALVFHLTAVSFNDWIRIMCESCSQDDIFSHWKTSVQLRCYQTRVDKIFLEPEEIESLQPRSTVTGICLPNQFLYAKGRTNLDYCLEQHLAHPHTVCALEDYDPTKCRCDSTTNNKLIIVLVVLSCLSLGLTIFLAHFITSIYLEMVLRYIVPVGLISTLFSAAAMIGILVLFGISRHQSFEGISGEFFLDIVQDDESYANLTNNIFNSTGASTYKASISWCFGLELIATALTLAASIVFTLMLLAKKRPN